MATTDFPLNSPLAVKLWSRKLFREALKETWFGKFMGEGSDNLVQVLTDTSKGAGDKVTFGLRTQLSGDGIQGDNTLEGFEEALNFYSDSLVVNQLRHAVVSAGKMSEQRVPYSMREEARLALTDWLADRLDTSLMNQLAGVVDQTDTRYTGNNATSAPTVVTGSRRLIVAGNATGAITTEGSLSATTTHAVKLGDLDRAVATAKTAGVPIRPIKAGGESYYVCFLHPYQVYQLRADTNTGQWADIQKAAMMGGKIKDNPIFTGALGIYNNVVLHESTRCPYIDDAIGATYTSYRRGVFCGAQAAAVAFGQGHSQNSMGWDEEMFDYGNKLGVSAGLIFGVKKTVFNSTDFGTIVLSGYAPAP